MSDTEPAGEDGSRGESFVTAHPWLTGIFSVCIVVGAFAGALFLTEDWSIVRRVAAGAVAGAGIAMLVTGPKLMAG